MSTMTQPRASLRTGIVTALVAFVGASSSSCAIPSEQSGATIGSLPTSKSFIGDGVSTFMEHRCAGLDCHGQPGRPLRLYSNWGMRLVATKDGSRSAAGTTPDEQLENYRSVVGLEPENMAACFASQGAQFETFQLLKKPLDISGQGIRHKGGPVLRASESDPGWQCLYGWVSGKVDPKDCADGAKVK
jgi:hypothetical protein